MNVNTVYPLEKVLDVKRKRVEEAERALQRKREELAKEEEKLRAAEEAKRKVEEHRDAKLAQLRYEMDHGTTSPKIQQMKVYLKVVAERLLNEEKKVKKQEEQVEIAKKNVRIAEEELRRRRQEVDKLESHRKDWVAEMRRELAILEEKEQDEMGSVMFLTRRLQNR